MSLETTSLPLVSVVTTTCNRKDSLLGAVAPEELSTGVPSARRERGRHARTPRRCSLTPVGSPNTEVLVFRMQLQPATDAAPSLAAATPHGCRR